MSRLKRILIWSAAVLVTIPLGLILLANLYEDDVKEYLIGRLNERLTARVVINTDDIQFTLIKDFPQASLEMNNLLMYESYGQAAEKKSKPDTLLYARSLALQFSLFDLFSGDYAVKRLLVRTGRIKLKVNRANVNNWHFWKPGEESAEEKGSSVVKLDKIVLQNVQLTYDHVPNQFNMDLTLHFVKAEGAFSDEEYELSLNGDLLANVLRADDVKYLNGHKIGLDMKLDVDNKADVYRFSSGRGQIADMKLSVKGSYTDNDKGAIDLLVQAKDLEIASALSLLPSQYKEYIEDYSGEGELYFITTIKGNTGNGDRPAVTANFGIKDAVIEQKSSGLVLEQTNAEGFYRYESGSDRLELKSFGFKLSDGSMSGSLIAESLQSPIVSGKLMASMKIADLCKLIRLDSLGNRAVDSYGGHFMSDLNFKGKLKNKEEYRASDFANMNLSGRLAIDDAMVRFKDGYTALNDLFCGLTFDNNRIELNDFRCRTEKSDISLKGEVRDILNYILTEKGKLIVKAELNSDHLVMDEFLHSSGSSEEDSLYFFHLSPYIDFSFQSRIQSLTFRKFEASAVAGKFHQRDQILMADEIAFETMKGRVRASGLVNGREESRLMVSCDAHLEKLDIHELFRQMENFGQDFILDRHLKGIVTADVQFSSEWKPDLSVLADKIVSTSNMVVEKGELIGFEPLKNVSNYISLEELEHIRFSRLENTVEIRDSKVFIPKMDIYSSAIDITLSGVHSFTHEIDYHFRVLLADVLFKKAKKARRENDEFGVIEDDNNGRTSLFLSMSGTVDEPLIRYDRQGAKENFKRNIADEKNTLKHILKEEFNFFKNDTSVKKPDQKRNETGKFKIKWDEAPSKEKPVKEDEDF